MASSAWVGLAGEEGEPDWSQLAREFKACKQTFLLHVRSWEDCTTTHPLVWSHVEYHSTDDPVDERGVYAFVLDAGRHSPSPIPPLSFVLYIGETGDDNDRTLKTRLRDYRNKKSQRERANVYPMLETWGDALLFYFAAVDAGVSTKDLEAQMLDSLLPPRNQAGFCATVRLARTAAFS